MAAAGASQGPAPTASSSPARLLPSIAVGMVLGLIQVVAAVSFPALVFAGELEVFLPRVVGASLVAAAAVMVVVALRGTLPGTIGSVQDVTAAVLAGMAAGLASRLPAGREETFLTVALAIALTGAGTGILFYLLGALRFGNLIRFVPYPVVGGFMAGTGWLLVRGGAGVLAGPPLSISTLGDYASADLAARWGPGLAFAVILLLLVRRSSHVLVIPGAIVVATVAFFTVLSLTGTGVQEAEAGGWLLGPFPEARLWTPFVLESLGRADWGVVLAGLGQGAAVLVVATIALLLNASGIEVVAERDIDLDRELRAAGQGTALAAIAGGLIGFHSVGLTALAHRSRTPTRAVGLVGAAVCVATLFLGARAIGLLPRAVLGGMLVFLGLSFLDEWLWQGRRRLPGLEYLLVWLILLVIAWFGMLAGVGVGLAAATVLFVVAYGRIGAVKHEVSGAVLHSNVERSLEEREALRRLGERVHVMELQGYLFFGTASGLVDQVRARAADPERPALGQLVLDFRRVSGIDSSAVAGFEKIRRSARAAGVGLILTGLGSTPRRALDAGGLLGAPGISVLPDLDRGVELAEQRVLEAERAAAGTARRDGAAALLGDGVPASMVERLRSYVEAIDLEAGERLIRQGGVPEDLFVLEEGRLEVLLERAGTPIRLRSIAPGAIVGEMGLYLSTTRTADVVADGPSRVLRLPVEAFRRMERRDPDLAVRIHETLASLLAERLADNTRALRMLLE